MKATISLVTKYGGYREFGGWQPKPPAKRKWWKFYLRELSRWEAYEQAKL